MNIQVKITTASPASWSQLHTLWYASVKASHDFLTDADISAISPLVLEGLRNTQLYAAIAPDGNICGFIGISGQKIEMLFIHPRYFGQGYGTMLVRHAEEFHGTDSVDVNEQNGKALQFYLHLGFAVSGRSACDSSGAAFPLLHLHKNTAG